ncbi:hypothetical protein M0Q50_05020 [bacterium]|jgi:hypothetical protein|nr:hypothetical protein [bacterium]
MEVDNIGIFVEYDDEKLLTPEMIRCHLTPIRETDCIIEANTPQEAIEKFYLKFEAASWENPAVWINDQKPIIQYPPCEHLRMTKTSRFICGPKLRGEDCGTRGMCVLEWGIDPPPTGRCPIDEMVIDKTKTEEILVNGKKYLFVVGQ